MKLHQTKPFGPINDFSEVELPILTLLVGKNGSGKSQILEAIAAGAIKVDCVSDHRTEVVLKDFVSIRPDDMTRATGDGPLDPMALWQLISRRRQVLKRVWPSRYELFNSDRPTPDFEAGSPEATLANLGDDERWQHLMGLLSGDEVDIRGSQQQLRVLCQRLCKPLHELNQAEVLGSASNALSSFENKLSLLFRNYRVAQHRGATITAGNSALTYEEGLAIYAEKNQPPWDMLKNALGELRVACGDDQVFDFDLTDPSQTQPTLFEEHSFTFTCEIVARTSGTPIAVRSLSSGEKVLLGLCLAAFNHDSGAALPKLLLLDEVDAVLHPSMIKGLRSIMERVFIEAGVHVILATHSPTTVALLGDENVFEVHRNSGKFRLEKIPNDYAVRALSEGVATLKDGLVTMEGLRHGWNILTEGNNTIILEKWISLINIRDVRVVSAGKARSGVEQLMALAELALSMNTSKKVLFVLDVDARNKKVVSDLKRTELYGKNGNVEIFTFDANKHNTVATTGIENAFSEKLLVPFTEVYVGEDGKTHNSKIKPDQKANFSRHVAESGKLSDFMFFKKLEDKIRQLLDGDGEKQQA